MHKFTFQSRIERVSIALAVVSGVILGIQFLDFHESYRGGFFMFAHCAMSQECGSASPNEILFWFLSLCLLAASAGAFFWKKTWGRLFSWIYAGT